MPVSDLKSREHKPVQLLPDAREFVCGWGAASINVSVTFPLNKLQFRQQLHGIRTTTALRQLQKEGLLNLYRGLMPPFLQKTTSMALMFGMYDAYQHILEHFYPLTVLSAFGNKSLSAMLAGYTEAVLCPFERVQVLMQDKFYHDHYKNTYHVFKELRGYGIREYYRGLSPILLRNGFSNALFFLCRDKIKESFPQTTSQGTEVALHFVSGAVLGASISTLFYPLNVVKTRMQSRVGGEFTGLWTTFILVFQDRNYKWTKMFRGVHINFTRSLVSWGIINASYELLKKTFFSDTVKVS